MSNEKLTAHQQMLKAINALRLELPGDIVDHVAACYNDVIEESKGIPIGYVKTEEKEGDESYTKWVHTAEAFREVYMSLQNLVEGGYHSSSCMLHAENLLKKYKPS